MTNFKKANAYGVIAGSAALVANLMLIVNRNNPVVIALNVIGAVTTAVATGMVVKAVVAAKVEAEEAAAAEAEVNA